MNSAKKTIKIDTPFAPFQNHNSLKYHGQKPLTITSRAGVTEG